MYTGVQAGAIHIFGEFDNSLSGLWDIFNSYIHHSAAVINIYLDPTDGICKTLRIKLSFYIRNNPYYPVVVKK